MPFQIHTLLLVNQRDVLGRWLKATEEFAGTGWNNIPSRSPSLLGWQ
jgi:hypothetical protein